MKDFLAHIKVWMPLVTAAVGAFFGAIFAFAVSQKNEKIKRHREIWREHRNALVELEQRLNENLGLLSDNRFHAQNMLNSENTHQEKMLMTWGRPQLLPRDTDLPRSLQRIELLNELMSYNEKIRKLNHDTQQLCDGYKEMRTARLSNNVPIEQYKSSWREYCAGLKTLLGAYDLMDHRTETLLARVRVTQREDTKHDKCRFFKMPSLVNISEQQIEEEGRKLAEEMNQTQEKSRHDIDKFLSL